uniref:Uncharacterized protein n=1 Tax=Moorena producens (strain JHB) TaxID=1454205 RepID=A0A1D9G545_MOOP1
MKWCTILPYVIAEVRSQKSEVRSQTLALLDAKREWGKPRQSLMGETPKTALPSQDRNGALSASNY